MDRDDGRVGGAEGGREDVEKEGVDVYAASRRVEVGRKRMMRFCGRRKGAARWRCYGAVGLLERIDSGLCRVGGVWAGRGER